MVILNHNSNAARVPRAAAPAGNSSTSFVCPYDEKKRRKTSNIIALTSKDQQHRPECQSGYPQNWATHFLIRFAPSKAPATMTRAPRYICASPTTGRPPHLACQLHTDKAHFKEQATLTRARTCTQHAFSSPKPCAKIGYGVIACSMSRLQEMPHLTRTASSTHQAPKTAADADVSHKKAHAYKQHVRAEQCDLEAVTTAAHGHSMLCQQATTAAAAAARCKGGHGACNCMTLIAVSRACHIPPHGFGAMSKRL